MWMMMMTMMGNMMQTSPNTNSSSDNNNDQKKKSRRQRKGMISMFQIKHRVHILHLYLMMAGSDLEFDLSPHFIPCSCTTR